MNFVIFSLYRYLVMPAAVLLMPFLGMFNRKLREGLKLRGHRAEPLPDGNDPIWIHASSGEFEYAKSVIRELKTEYPDVPIVVTYFSPTFSKAVMNFPNVDRAIALPLDLPGPCQSFLKKMHPRIFMIARTDLWPEMLEQCRRHQIPVVIFSYTQRELFSRLKRMFHRWTMHWISRIYCVSETDRENLEPLALDAKVEVMGDTRYDQVAFRLAHPKAIAPGLHPKDDIPCLVAGSTWSEDEEVLLPAVKDSLQAHRLRLILVPHEPTADHIAGLEKQLKQMGLTYALFSSGSWDGEHVLLVDKTGVLAELYLWGKFAFVGGSFRKTVHSVMEALGAGCLTFVGPKHENNREALQFRAIPMGVADGLEVVNDAKEFQLRLETLLKTDLSEYHQTLKRHFASRLGASRKLTASLSDLII